MEFKLSDKLDCRGQLCPVPVLMTEEKIHDMKTGQTLEVAFTDPGAVPDLTAWCKVAGHELLGFKKNRMESFAIIRKK